MKKDKKRRDNDQIYNPLMMQIIKEVNEVYPMFRDVFISTILSEHPYLSLVGVNRNQYEDRVSYLKAKGYKFDDGVQ